MAISLGFLILNLVAMALGFSGRAHSAQSLQRLRWMLPSHSNFLRTPQFRAAECVAHLHFLTGGREEVRHQLSQRLPTFPPIPSSRHFA